MWGPLLALIGGIAYGYLSPGREDKSRLLVKGFLIGLVIAVVLSILGAIFGANPLGLGGAGFIDLIIATLVIVLAFVVGVWIGDAFENREAKKPSPPRTV
ncbi:MAG TPA: hypothetical protein VM889_14200 [Candidatus Thermoplasmatota archaeon]|nr:hypothetical protein [Candidatus Thermoplasmatota archaeon]